MAVTTLYLTRHGQTEWNVARKMQGHQDSPLTSLGKTQAAWLGEALAEVPLDRIYSSSSPRAVRTAEIIRGGRKLDIAERDSLREMNLGEWEGQSLTDIEQREPERHHAFWKAPHQFRAGTGESYEEVKERAVGEVLRITEENPGKSMLIVTHTVALKLIMAHFESRDLRDLWELPYIHPTCLCKVELTDGVPRIVLHADISHYKNEIEGAF
ncbi:histidine phosphatase family protein [Paenibacillus chitinolyticus]|uniref:Histidine phosphatase family protein n=1 Tax=Paenibacillus chitinolyticus TaxID=79263 RepID=A0A410X403_9BACL|nr:histidine phosphatase family protein [Paenibacillus chitinolyticus]MCY9590013.1 histidine phosphatase family protein [Paenibacillus chitinolyticus]MCY9597058.1 histidine phosphatase family protein [Paenibacillus chitinolyticus]QAV21325.1 histidine phosphatase family protein [Paenibacillus chitinolyticus]